MSRGSALTGTNIVSMKSSQSDPTPTGRWNGQRSVPWSRRHPHISVRRQTVHVAWHEIAILELNSAHRDASSFPVLKHNMSMTAMLARSSELNPPRVCQTFGLFKVLHRVGVEEWNTNSSGHATPTTRLRAVQRSTAPNLFDDERATQVNSPKADHRMRLAPMWLRRVAPVRQLVL